MTHDAEEAEEYERSPEQAEAFTDARSPVGTFLFDGGGAQSRYGKEADYGVDREE